MRLFAPFLRLPRWLLSGVCTALILYLTLYPKPLPDNDIRFWEHTDKVVHAIMFGALYVCLALDIWRGRKTTLQREILLAAAVALFGGFIELAQQAMNMGRGGSVADWLADIGGVIAAVALIWWCTRSRQASRPQ